MLTYNLCSGAFPRIKHRNEEGMIFWRGPSQPRFLLLRDFSLSKTSMFGSTSVQLFNSEGHQVKRKKKGWQTKLLCKWELLHTLFHFCPFTLRMVHYSNIYFSFKRKEQNKCSEQKHYVHFNVSQHCWRKKELLPRYCQRFLSWVISLIQIYFSLYFFVAQIKWN